MITRRPIIKYGDMEWVTYVDIDGVEHTVTVYYETSPEEADVNWPGGCDLADVFYKKESVLSRLTDEAVDDLKERLNDYENDRHNPDNDPRW